MTDYSAELARILPGQTHTIARHNLPNGQIVWVRQTGKTIPQWRYSLLGFVARHLRLGALQPVPTAAKPSPPKPRACGRWPRTISAPRAFWPNRPAA